LQSIEGTPDAAEGARYEPGSEADFERLTRAIVNKILHHPVTALRRHQSERGETFHVEAARSLFRLGGDEPPDDEEEG